MGENGRFSEFVTVLFFALVIGAGVWLSTTYLKSDTARGILLIVLLAAAVIVLQYLRKRFQRGG